MSIMDKLRKNSTVKASSIVADSQFFGEKELVNTGVPALNIALSGDIDGGLASGLTVIAGPSKPGVFFQLPDNPRCHGRCDSAPHSNL